MKPTTFFRLTLAAATLVSLAGNSAHAILTHNAVTPLWFAVAWAAVPPLALPLTVHGAGVLARAQGRGWAYRSVVAAVAAIAALAFVISFVALRDLTAAMGSPAFIAVLFPVLVDATATVATVALLVLDGDARTIAAHHPAVDGALDAHHASEPRTTDAEPAHHAPGDGAPLAEVVPAAHHLDVGGAPSETRASELRTASTSGDAAHAPLVRDAGAPVVRDDADPAPSDDAARTTGVDVVRDGDALAALAAELVRAGATRAPAETVHVVLVRTAEGASSRTVAEEVDGLSYSAVQRIVRAARDLGELPTAEPKRNGLSLVG